MILPRKSSKYGTVHPPDVKFPLVSSVGPPGACMTPSSVMNDKTIIFLIKSTPFNRWIMGKVNQSRNVPNDLFSGRV
jgi:hypothetical protein